MKLPGLFIALGLILTLLPRTKGERCVRLLPFQGFAISSREAWSTTCSALSFMQVRAGASMWPGTFTPHWARTWPYSALSPFRRISALTESKSTGRKTQPPMSFMPMVPKCWRCTEGKLSSLGTRTKETAASWSKTSGRQTNTFIWESLPMELNTVF